MVSLLKCSVLLKMLYEYLPDINRFNNFDYQKLIKYRNSRFRKLIKYAFNVPLYKKKFEKEGIKKDSINGIEDIEKLPIITRQDIIKYFPNGIIPKSHKKKSVFIDTSGSTRKPISYFTDQYTLMKNLILYVRQLRYYGIKWNKSKITMIANFYSRSGPTQYFNSGAIPTLKPFFSLGNFQLLNCYDDLKEMMNKINSFNPDFICGFPGPIRHLALLKNRGYGSNVNPISIISSGALLGYYDKKFIEETFDVPVYNLYGSTEAGPISFECKHGKYHINSDYLYLETLDRDFNVLDKGKSGLLSLTRIYGLGTPLIRYTGMNDIITIDDKTCDCGLQTEIIKRINGRIK